MSFDSNSRTGIKVRFLTDINKDNISLCKELMKLTTEVRHLEGIKANFAVRNKEYIGIASLKKEAQQQEAEERLTHFQSHIIYSNVKSIIEQQQYLFNNLWEKSISAEQRIKELEERIQSEFFNIIMDNKRISQILIDLVNSVANEIVLLLPNDKVLVRIDRLGIKPDAENFLDAIGFAVYSNNERSTELFRWMFELLWNERMVNEKSKHDNKIQDQFVNIAAHELRSPAQSIIGYTELMLTDPEYKQVDKKEGFLEAIYRNSLRLSSLTNELLDVSRIEKQTIQLDKQKFKLNDVISFVIKDVQKQRHRLTIGTEFRRSAKITYPNLLEKEEQSNDDANSNDVFVEADKERITQVLINLLDNALKSTN